MRRNVVEDRTGVPLTLRLRVIDSATCRPLRNAGVEIWHCDALGVYSGYTASGSGGGGMPTPPSGDPSAPPGGGAPGGGHATPTDDLTFLRGLQISDHLGYVVFATIVPGWYAGRAVHIHTKVHTDGTATKTGYTGGHTCHTGQFYFAETLISRFAGIEPYTTNETTRTTLDSQRGGVESVARPVRGRFGRPSSSGGAAPVGRSDLSLRRNSARWSLGTSAGRRSCCRRRPHRLSLPTSSTRWPTTSV
jgi:protocatechuate 3,4-dioxygenase beta subunit